MNELTDLQLRTRIAQLEDRRDHLATEIRKLEEKRDRKYRQARARVKSKIDGYGWSHSAHGLRDGTAEDLNWATLGIENNLGWIVNHAGLRVVRGTVKEEVEEDAAVDASGYFFGAEEE